MKVQSLLILGGGYTGRRLADEGFNRGWSVFETHRSQPLVFHLGQPQTWKTLPEADAVIWTFPIELHREAAQLIKNWKSRMVAIGTTSSYATTMEDEVITEDSPLDMSEARVTGEEIIRNAGGNIVRAAGIYGPGRNPLRWIQSGLVGRSEKLVNFIHVDDLVQILFKALESPLKGMNFLAADGRPQRWSHLIDRWQKAYSLEIPEDAPASRRASKSVDPSQTFKTLGVQLRYEDVFSGVRALVESQTS